MAKATKAPTQAPTQAAQPVQVYTPNPKYTPRVNHNGSTFGLLVQAAQANGGTLTAAQARVVCKEAKHSSFYAWALKQRILLPVQAD